MAMFQRKTAITINYPRLQEKEKTSWNYYEELHKWALFDFFFVFFCTVYNRSRLFCIGINIAKKEVVRWEEGRIFSEIRIIIFEFEGDN